MAALVAAAIAVYHRLRRGRQLLVLRATPAVGKMRWVFRIAIVAEAVPLLLLSPERFGAVGLLAGCVALGALGLCEYLIERSLPEPAGHCALHENGVLFADRLDQRITAWRGSEGGSDRLRERFIAWTRIRRFEWDGDTLVLSIAPRKAARPVSQRSVDVPPERRGEVMEIVVSRVRG
jgi:hypothetical protein